MEIWDQPTDRRIAVAQQRVFCERVASNLIAAAILFDDVIASNLIPGSIACSYARSQGLRAAAGDELDLRKCA